MAVTSHLITLRGNLPTLANWATISLGSKNWATTSLGSKNWATFFRYLPKNLCFNTITFKLASISVCFNSENVNLGCVC